MTTRKLANGACDCSDDSSDTVSLLDVGNLCAFFGARYFAGRIDELLALNGDDDAFEHWMNNGGIPGGGIYATYEVRTGTLNGIVYAAQSLLEMDKQGKTIVAKA